MDRQAVVRLIEQAAAEQWEELDLAGLELTELPPEIGQLGQLKRLILGKWDREKQEIVGNQLTTLPSELAQLQQLEVLDLCYNQLTTLSEVVGQLMSLQVLNLRGNQLTTLPDTISQLTSLQALDLGGNQLTSLPGTISKLRALQSLDLRSTQITTLPEVIGQLTTLQSLNLHNNQLKTLPKVTEQLTTLKSLDLSYNELTTLPEVIGSLTALRFLGLSYNQLTRLPEGVGQLSALQELDLSGNQLMTLPEAIGRLMALQKLYLRDNQLTTLPEAIGALTALQSLDLYNNQLTALLEAIGSLTALQSLNLWNNQLTTLPEGVGQLTALQELNLNANQLRTLPEVIEQLTALQSLSLGLNQLITLPNIIGQLSGLQFLDLKANQLMTLPEAIGQLTALQSLDLRHNQLTTLPEAIGSLTALQSLDLSFNQLTTLPEAIGQLVNLQSLNLMSNQISVIPEVIGQLTNLQTLIFKSNQISIIPDSISQLVNLQMLSLVENQISIFPEAIAQLSNLQKLYLGSNKISEIPEWIGQMSSLRVFGFTPNSTQILPRALMQMENLEVLRLAGNPLAIPTETLRQGWGLNSDDPGNPKAVLDYYFATRDPNQTQILYEAKLLLVGEGGAGKTSLANKLLNPNYQLQPETADTSTQGIDILDWEFIGSNGQPYKIHIWDFGGQEIYHQTHQFFLTERACYLLVADSRKENTDHYFWLDSIKLLSKDSPVHLIQNEKQDRTCTLNANQLRGEFANLHATHRVNLADNRGLPALQTPLQQELQNLIPQGIPFPNKWLAVRYSLENDGRNYIDYRDYEATCRRHGITSRDQMLNLSRFLHELGICLHFQKDPILSQRLILKPNWGTTAVYKILDNARVKGNLGQFSDADLIDIWVDRQYDDMRHPLLQLMKEFKVCYEIPRRPGHYIAPHLLSTDTLHYPPLTADHPLILRYRYPGFMPKGILTRFIVEMHQVIENVSDPQTAAVWKTGVVLSKGAARAEVIEHYHQREIHIRVVGSRPRDLLTIINHKFEEIHYSFYEDAIFAENPPFDTLIPCNCLECKPSQNPYLFALHKLELWLSKGRFKIQCHESGDNNVDIRRLIDGVIFDYANAALENPELDRGTRKRRDRLRPPTQSPNISVNVNALIHNQNEHEQTVTNDKIWHGDRIDGDKVMGDKVEGNKMQIHTVQGDAVAGNKIVNSQNLAQAAQDIKALLSQFASDYDTTTPGGKMSLIGKVLDAVEKNSTIKSRTVNALKESGKAALEAAIDHPVAKVLVAGLEGYMEA
jgi:internalin A